MPAAGTQTDVAAGARDETSEGSEGAGDDEDARGFGRSRRAGGTPKADVSAKLPKCPPGLP